MNSLRTIAIACVWASLAACSYKPGEHLDTDAARHVLASYEALPIQPWSEPKVEMIPAGESGEQIRYGAALLQHTAALIGPHAADPRKRLAGNNLNCTNCHQVGQSGLPGTKAFVLPYTNVAHEYPKLDVKTMRVLSLEDRIIGMLGHGAVVATAQTPEVQAIVAYMTWLGFATFPHERLEGTGLAQTALPQRPADPQRGKQRYTTWCSSCHGADGQGQRAADFAQGGGYKIPPIAGDDSYDDGGHMYMVPLLARFVHSAMPLGASYDAPVVSIDDAYDIAAYINSALPRRHNAQRGAFYPDAAFRAPGFAIPELYPDAAALARAKFGPF